MSGTFAAAQLRDLVAGSLGVWSGEFLRRADGSYVYRGVRPSSEGEWHAHGTFPRLLWVVDGSRLVRIVLRKQRWLDLSTGTTCHSRSPLESPSTGFSTLVVVLSLWTWLDMPSVRSGLEQLVEGPTDVPSPRTVQRMLRTALREALTIQHALRYAVIERSEPRPIEQLFEGGLSPPRQLQEKRWRAPDRVCWLWTGLALLFHGAIALCTHPTLLLAEARGRVKQVPLPI